MVFSSNVFIFLFLPLFLAAYYLAPQRARAYVIVGGSALFYAWWRVDFLVLFACVAVFNYFVGQNIAGHGPRTKAARPWLVAGVVVDLAVLGCFKYANFGVDTLNALLQAGGAGPIEWTKIILPIGISFYIFESISYISDVYRGDTKPARSFIDFACFVALFPHLIAGPVFRYKDLEDQFAERTHSVDKFAEGATRFMQGFVKKVFIADSIAPMVSAGFALADPTTADAWTAALAYTAQLYFDFSGYSDMAIGLGLMMGFRFVENFNQPYISQSITEFWRRWHMSLSAWLRDYLYIALGGNRGGAARTYRNLFLTMLLGGLWHGANWTFLLWGAWHGAWLSAERALGVRVSKAQTENGAGNATEGGAAPARFRVMRWLTTFFIVVLGWVMFRADHVGEAMRMYAAMFRFDGLGLGELYASSVTRLQVATLALAFAVVALRGWRSRQVPASVAGAVAAPRSLLGQFALGGALPILFALAVLKLSAQSYSPFLYFQF